MERFRFDQKENDNMTTEAFAEYPPINEEYAEALLNAELRKNAAKLVVLDDDPTGVQTVHDVTVYTDWSLDSLRRGFAEENRMFFLLTNSRAMTARETTEVHEEITRRVAAVARETGKKYLYISRSDSTLRGHYPLETRLLKEGLEREGFRVDGEILCPFFKEGGRFTMGNVHYVRYGDDLVPAAETEFAQDKTFGFSKSALPDYVEEKTGGAYKAGDVVCIPLEMIRRMDVDLIVAKLLAVKDFQKICVNAIEYADVKVFAAAVYRAMGKGKTFVFRCAASLVKVMGGVDDRPLLTRADMIVTKTAMGGLVAVGSHTRKTTLQLEALLKLENSAAIPFQSDLILAGEAAFDQEINRCVALAEQAIRAGKDAVCFTGRTLLSLPEDTRESALRRSVQIGEGIWKLVSRLRVEPAFIIAKGGITSSDVGVKGLGVRQARAMGQICPGVPVWRTGGESKFPGIPYVIFPGNVGGETTLREAVETFRQ